MPDDQNLVNDTALPASDDLALPASDELALPASSMPELEAGDEEEVVEAFSADDLAAQAEGAEAFGESLIALQNVIHRYSGQQDELNKKMKEIRESLKNMFENDEELQKLEAQQKTANTDVKQKKQRIKESPEAVQLQMKLKEFQEEMNEMQQSLSNHLLRYYQMTGSQVIEEADGGEREFNIKARLKAKKSAA